MPSLLRCFLQVREIIHGKKADPTIERWVHLLTLFGSLWMDACMDDLDYSRSSVTS
ncbi:hypothetical protein LR48_Vigan06g044900 [Vigna angularis]|uniref:Uncharacterized protein n=1 Tax=Phaseolus angularis TaxID=3914 RepID=A0A0L9UQW0_PHAAN|nr:hypothetical protein LR48_Vigan06g044900 [Vigna angularis]